MKERMETLALFRPGEWKNYEGRLLPRGEFSAFESMRSARKEKKGKKLTTKTSLVHKFF
jgi:hypothetical protein